jgi:hypothetical protein
VEAGSGEAERGLEEAGGHGSGQQTRVLAAEALMGRVGSLRLYEILIGLLFISVIISWNPYTLPL